MAPLLIALSGRSGSGKTELARGLLAAFSSKGIRMLTSSTTRGARPSDLPSEYEHLSLEVFKEAEASGAFLWTAGVGETKYGTKRSGFMDACAAGLTLLILTPETLPIVWNEARKMSPSPSILFFFLEVADEEVLRTRLTVRDGAEAARRRMALDQSWPGYIQNMGIPYTTLVSTEEPRVVLEKALDLIKKKLTSPQPE